MLLGNTNGAAISNFSNHSSTYHEMQENNNQDRSIPCCCGEMPSDQLQWIVEFSINRGKQAEFQRLAKEISGMVRRFEPGTRRYEWFLSAGGNKCIVIEWYDSSVSGIAHVQGEVIKKIFPQILKIAKITRFVVCGDPSEELIHELAHVDPDVYRFMTGYSR